MMSRRRRPGAARSVVALLALLVVAACAGDDPFAPLPEPDDVEIEETTTTTEPDLTGVLLPPALGATSTTAVALGPGPMTIVGRVEGPEGPVANAIVQLDRLVGDGVATARVPTAADGTWNAADVLGGRYRIRAWRAPDLVTPGSTIVFLESGPTRAVDLRLDPVGGVRVDHVIAPDPPYVDEPGNLKVRVAERFVDAEGVVRDTPIAGVVVTLGGSGSWSVGSSNPATTGIDGSVVFLLTCREEGAQQLAATVDGQDTYALALQPCIERGATTTTEDPSSPSSTTSTTNETTTTEP